MHALQINEAFDLAEDQLESKILKVRNGQRNGRNGRNGSTGRKSSIDSV